MKRLFLVLGWYITSLVTLTVSISTIAFLRKTQHIDVVALAANSNAPAVTALELPPEVKGLSIEMKADDARPYIIAQFLERYNSPLTPYDYWGKYLTALADQYGLDFRLLPAMAMQESNLCKKKSRKAPIIV